MISIHALREEGDPAGWCPRRRKSNFYPRPPRGGRRTPCSLCLRWTSYFYPRPPRGGRPSKTLRRERSFRFLSTPSARRATDAPPPRAALPTRISIHALREEGDVAVVALLHDVCNFYPRPPRGGRLANIAEQRVDFFISIHALREEGDTLAATLARTYKISIHALREEGDHKRLERHRRTSKFLSTPSARRATPECGQSGHKQHDFYPRPPRGGRPRLLLPCIRKPGNFYPRPPRGGRPTYKHVRAAATIISIHALREEGDLPACKAGRIRRAFLSTPSARRATCPAWPRFCEYCYFYPRPPRGGRHSSSDTRKNLQDFYPRPPRGGRLRILLNSALISLFLSTPSARRATGYEDE